MKPAPMSDEVLERLDRYHKTVISPSCFRYYNESPASVVAALKKRGFVDCRCWTHDSWFLDGQQKSVKETSIIIEGRRKEVRG